MENPYEECDDFYAMYGDDCAPEDYTDDTNDWINSRAVLLSRPTSIVLGGILFYWQFHQFFNQFLCILPLDFFPEMYYNKATKVKEEFQMNEQDILRYGKYITDESYTTWDHHVYRLRAIRYKDHLYWHKMVDGEVVEFKILR